MIVVARHGEPPGDSGEVDKIFIVPPTLPTQPEDVNPYTIILTAEDIGGKLGEWYFGVRERDSSFINMPSPEIRELEERFPTGEETLFQHDYNITIWITACYVYDASKSDWTSEGCEVSQESTPDKTVGRSTLLTTFTAGFFVPPNTIDWNLVFNNADFLSNPTLYITEIVIFFLFAIGFFFARRKDKHDAQLLGLAPLADNRKEHKYYYEIYVSTGMRRGAGTDSNVYFILSGDEDETEVRMFNDDKRPIFKKGMTNGFLMAVPSYLGRINYMRVWHDNSGKDPFSSWYLNYIAVRDLQTNERHIFVVDRWFALEKDDGQIDRVIPLAGKEQLEDFSYQFSERCKKDFVDGHLWFSVIAHPPGSRFTCVQRVACCLCLLCLTMLTNAMFYNTSGTPSSTSTSLALGPFTLGPSELFTGFISTLIVFPVSFLLVFMFRRSKPRCKRPSRITLAFRGVSVKQSDGDGASQQLAMTDIAKSQEDLKSLFSKSILKQSSFVREVSVHPSGSSDEGTSQQLAMTEIAKSQEDLKSLFSESRLKQSSFVREMSVHPSGSSGEGTSQQQAMAEIAKNQEDLNSPFSESRSKQSSFVREVSVHPSGSSDEGTSQQQVLIETVKNREDMSTPVSDSGLRQPSCITVNSPVREVKTELVKSREDFNNPFSQITDASVSLTSRGEIRPTTEKNPFQLPWWCVIIAWVLLIICTLGSAVLVTFYGITFKDDQCKKWITSLIFSFFASIFLTQPLKVILFAMLLTLIFKKTGDKYDDSDADDLEQDTSDLDYLHATTDSATATAKPKAGPLKAPSREEVEQLRTERLKEVKMWSVIREIIFYCIFILVLLALCHINRGPDNFWYKDTMFRTFIKSTDTDINFEEIQTTEDFWGWAKTGLLNGLIAGQYYNAYPPLRLRTYINDKVSRMLGYATLRQLRVHPGQCKVHSFFEDIIRECNVLYSEDGEERRSFGLSWEQPENPQLSNRTEYTWTDADSLNSYPHWGKLSVYSGGGYLVRLNGSKQELFDLFTQLEQEEWIDKYTRAVFVEFSVYNPQ
ncbi:polycystic kidney disease 1 2-like protein, partial [Plakobranchus ocellatus]